MGEEQGMHRGVTVKGRTGRKPIVTGNKRGRYLFSSFTYKYR